MDNRPIGVFDSGLGGLTAVRALQQAAPLERVVYFGDTGRVPYGGRSADTITTYTRQALTFLQAQDVKFIIVACGTASAVALPRLTDHPGVPRLGVVEAAAGRAAAATQNGRIGIIGTAATVNSGAYVTALHARNGALSVSSVACPLLVPLVENGRLHRGDIVVETVVREYLEPLKAQHVDTLILGCTHYPLLSQRIADEMGADVTLVDSGREAALSALAALKTAEQLADHKRPDRYYVSDSAPGFAALASLFLQTDIGAQVQTVVL